MKDNSIYKIAEDINRIFFDIENNYGEISKEQEELLEIKQEELKSKLSSYCTAIKAWNNDNDYCSNEIKRLQELKKVRTNRIDRLKDIIKIAVIQFGNTGKSGNKVIELPDNKLYTKNVKSTEFNKERIELLKSEFIDYCYELYKEGILETGEEVDTIGIINAINAKCIAEYGEDFIPFTKEDFESFTVNINFTVSLKDLISGNNYILKTLYSELYPATFAYEYSASKFKVDLETYKDKITLGEIKYDQTICMK